MTRVNKQLVNLIGGAASIAIIVLGVVVFAIPLYGSARTINSEADTVAQRNSTAQSTLDALRAQSAAMSALNNTVASLRVQIPVKPQVEDVLSLASRAAAAHGATVTAVTPTPAVAFAERTSVIDPAAAANAAPAPAAPVATPAPGDPSAAAGAPPANPATGAQQSSVLVTISVPTVAAATAIVDELRAGPRLIAILNADVSNGNGSGSASASGLVLKVAVLAFSQP